jgi:sarcosine oxidase subunit beta
MKKYDVIVIGAGSVGLPVAVELAERKLSVLSIDSLPGPGQANNKKAIGGVRATHSDFGKIQTCLRSIEILSTWKETFGDDIGWMSNGYSYPAYTEEHEKKFKDLMKIQHQFGLNIKWVSPEEYNELVPGIEMKDLRGSTYSPEDGSCSPLLTMSAYYFRALRAGVDFRFNEKVVGMTMEGNKVVSVITETETYACDQVVNAAGNYAREIGAMVGLDVKVFPDNHEAAISDPVKRFFGPMVIDMRKGESSSNFYFYQNHEGQIVFCYTPAPAILGIDNEATSEFLPNIARRMLRIYPRLRYYKVRRTWRGQYPMTPDGFPIVGRTNEVPNYINCVGMCGQGFMLGPGMGELVARIVTNTETEDDIHTLKSYDFYRDYSGMEAFK